MEKAKLYIKPMRISNIISSCARSNKGIFLSYGSIKPEC